MNGIHYNHVGIKLLAKEIKKSLYSLGNKESKRLETMRDMLNTPSRNTKNAPSSNDGQSENAQSHVNEL